MTHRMRIRRTPAGSYRLPAGAAEPSPETYRQLQQAIRRYLSPTVATLLSEPVMTADGKSVDWFTSLEGHPVALNALSDHDRHRVRQLLDERVGAIRHLARRLPEIEMAAGLDKLLLRSTTYPAEDAVYAVDGQPVITFWGYGELPPAEPMEPPEPQWRTPAGRWIWIALAILLLLGGLAWGVMQSALFAALFRQEDYVGMLEAERASGEDLRRSLLERQVELVRSFNACARQTRLDVLQHEHALLAERFDRLALGLGRAVDVCRLKRDLDALTKQRAVLNEKRQILQRELIGQRAKCRDRSLDTARTEARRLRARMASLKKALAGKLEQCGKAPQPAALPPATPIPATPKPEKKADVLPPCPGERPPEEAPDVAIVLDASGSMRIPAVLDAQNASAVTAYEGCMMSSGVLGPVICAGLAAAYEAAMGTGHGPNRLEAAQQAVTRVVSGLPQDVDVGLAVLEDCPGATDYGLYEATRRAQLLQTINGLAPRKGTPLADGLVQAAKRVDGIRAPAVMVVVSDGKDSCNRNPCAVAAELKAAKPKLKINVVDIVGDGAVNCLANMTGGDVLTPRSGLTLDQLVRKAAREAEKPEHCK